MIKGVLTGLLAFAVFSCCDAVVKSLGPRLPVFEMGFFITLFSMYAVPLVRRRSERWRDIFRMHRPRLVVLRMCAGALAGIMGVYAFTTLPLAEVYSLIFLSPLFVTLLSIPFLGEQVGWRRGLAVVIGFAGVLLVVRPGFRELSLGHLAAVGVAFAGAATVIILRALGPTEKRITLMGTVMLAALGLNFALMLFDFHTPSPTDILRCAVAGLLAGLGHILLMSALREAPASRVAPAQYSQIIWAMILGSIFFGEFPDRIALAGIALVTFSGLFTFAREQQKGGRWPPVWTVVWTRSPRNGRRG